MLKNVIFSAKNDIRNNNKKKWYEIDIAKMSVEKIIFKSILV